jgi:hypothetical protein
MNKEKAYWKKWYLAVFLFLLLQVLACFFITRHFK